MIAFSLGGSFGGARGPIPVLKTKQIRIATVDTENRKRHKPAIDAGRVLHAGRVPLRHDAPSEIKVNPNRQPWQAHAAKLAKRVRRGWNDRRAARELRKGRI